MKFITMNKIHDVTLKTWDGERWSPDMFAELETLNGIACEYDYAADAYLISEEDFAELVDYWQNEVDTFNAGGKSEQFCRPDDKDAPEWGLFVSSEAYIPYE